MTTPWEKIRNRLIVARSKNGNVKTVINIGRINSPPSAEHRKDKCNNKKPGENYH
jgi:hypothetical protein